MPDLNLPVCPICLAGNSLSRQTMNRAGQVFTWYECRECGSVLLWMGGGQWAYQKMGREDKLHLLKMPMTEDKLRALSRGFSQVSQRLSPAESQPSADLEPTTPPVDEKRTKWAPSRLFLVGIAATVLCFTVALIIVMLALFPPGKGATLSRRSTPAVDAGTSTGIPDTQAANIPVVPTPIRLEAETVEELEQAILNAPEGATIFLSSPTYTLTRPLEIQKSLTLAGSGMDETEITSHAGGRVLFFAGDGAFAAADITFRYRGETAADVVVVTGGDVTFTGCRFKGARSVEEEGRAGLVLKGNTTALVQNCVAAENGTRGIRVAEQAQATLENNTCTGNEKLGIGFFDSSGGVARKNNCSQNGGNGIQASGQAQPILEDNTCLDNHGMGIAYFETSGGRAQGNNSSMNGIGIGVGGQGQPTLQDNICDNNKLAGISYFESSGGAAVRNRCTGSEGGIVLNGQAQPVLDENVCHDNRRFGIAYFESAGGISRRNECSGNSVGVSVLEQSAPTLEENNCTDNERAGILYSESSSGEARKRVPWESSWDYYLRSSPAHS